MRAPISPDDLRAAAVSMRLLHGPDHQRHEMWVAIARWLDHVAMTYEGEPDPGEYTEFIDALAVAKAYLEAST